MQGWSDGRGDKISTEEIKAKPKLKSMREYLQDGRLQWFGHLEKVDECLVY